MYISLKRILYCLRQSLKARCGNPNCSCMLDLDDPMHMERKLVLAPCSLNKATGITITLNKRRQINKTLVNMTYVYIKCSIINLGCDIQYLD